jgi:AcrR family transcriptional regulator
MVRASRTLASLGSRRQVRCPLRLPAGHAPPQDVLKAVETGDKPLKTAQPAGLRIGAPARSCPFRLYHWHDLNIDHTFGMINRLTATVRIWGPAHGSRQAPRCQVRKRGECGIRLRMRVAGSKNAISAEHRRALLDVALRLFAERGLNAVSINAIAQEIGVTKGSVYHHFGSKEDIAVELYQESVAAILESTQQALRHAVTAKEGVTGLISNYLAWFGMHLNHGKFVFWVMSGNVFHASLQTILAAQDASVAESTRWLDPYIERGEVRAMSPQLRAAVVLGPSREFLRGWLASPSRRAMTEAMRELPLEAWMSIRA